MFPSHDRAGYSPKRARQEGSELTNPRLSPLVVKHIGELKEERLRKHEVTYEGHVAELARLREAALKKGSFSSAVNAEANRGKAAGLYIDRKIIKTGKLEDLSEQELENKMKQILSDYAPLLDAKQIEGEVISSESAGLYIDRKIIKTGKLEDLSEQELENKMKQIGS